MGNIVIATPEWGDQAAVTSPSEETEAPATNVQKMRPRPPYRSTTATNGQIDLARVGSLGAAPFGLVGLFYLRHVSELASFRFRAALSAGEIDTDPVFDSSQRPGVSGNGWGECVRLHNRSLDNQRIESDAPIAGLGSSDFTLELWVRPKGIKPCGILSLGPLGSGNAVRITMEPDGTPRASDEGGNADVRATQPLEADVWTHLAVVYDDTPPRSLTLYIDGKLDAQQPNISALNDPSGDLEVGPQIGTRFFGDVDDVRVWNVVRSAAEVLGGSLAPIPSPYPAGLMLYWTFDGEDPTSSAVTDKTTNGRDGNLMPLFSPGQLSPVWCYPDFVWARGEPDGRSSVHAAVFIPNGVNASHGRLEILDEANGALVRNDGSASPSHVDLGRLFIGRAFQPALNWVLGGSPLIVRDRSQRSQDLEGNPIVRVVPPSVGCDVTLQFAGEKASADPAGEAEWRANLERVFRERAGQDVGVLLDTKDDGYRHQRIVHGLMPAETSVRKPRVFTHRARIRVDGFGF